MVPRAALFTATANTTQDGIAVRATDTSLRWLGWFKTSNTDGLIDYSISGKYRFAIFNQDNRVGLTSSEFYTASATYDKSPAMLSLLAYAQGGTGELNGAATTGGSSSFGSHVTGAGGTGVNLGVASSSVYAPRRSASGIKFAASVGATETVTVATQGAGAYVEVVESLQI
jgi:hypothetical protein